MKQYLIIYMAVLLGLTGCRTDDYIVYMEDENVGVLTERTEVQGMYLLNEGNMGSNKCTLDYLDLSADTVHYLRNIYAERNPNEVKELGDVGNDAQIYGSRLWLVINCSNKVEVCRAQDAVKLGQVDVPNCRNVAFHGGYAYVTSYVGPVNVSEMGRVYKVDTLTLQKVDSIVVGYQPEEMAVVDDKLYVANSGGYRAPDYDRTVSVVDLRTFTEERKIDVGVNLHRCRADRHGQLWVTSRGDNRYEQSKVYWLAQDAQGQMQVGGSIDVPVSDLCIVGDSLYFYGSDYSAVTYDVTEAYGIINVSTHQQVAAQLSSSAEFQQIKRLYGIIVHPANRDFYLLDARNYSSSGELLHFRADGSFDYKVRTGDVPAHAVFLTKSKK
ncbi:MAG: YncE family protein [Prevotella sp.]|nr:YncE family protein [Prevotella sp.]